MGVIQRGVVFFAGTTGNTILFLFHTRVVLVLLDHGRDIAGTGPATGALNLLPGAMQLAIGGIQVVLIAYLLGGLGQEKSTGRRPIQ